VNIAARIEPISLRGQVLMSEATYAHARDFVQAGEPMEVYVKGRAERVHVREALGIPSLGKLVPRQDMRKSPRVAARLELDYWPVEGKIVRAESARGVLRDIGYHGLRAELARPAPLYSELKLAFDLPPLGVRVSEVYARVVSLREQDGRYLVGVEFTSLDGETNANIELFVQMLLQGDYGGWS
jgi:adenylate cyclase